MTELEKRLRFMVSTMQAMPPELRPSDADLTDYVKNMGEVTDPAEAVALLHKILQQPAVNDVVADEVHDVLNNFLSGNEQGGA
jgi:hypothetical protein